MERLWSVYVIGSRKTGPLKIGTTNALWSRLDCLQCANPYPLLIMQALIVEQPCDAAALEKEAHRRLADCRLMGEWFDAHHDLIAGVLTEVAIEKKIVFHLLTKAAKEITRAAGYVPPRPVPKDRLHRLKLLNSQIFFSDSQQELMRG